MPQWLLISKEKVLFLFLSYIRHTSFSLALTFKATTDGVIHNVAFCIELMQKREEIWRKKYEKVTKLIILYVQIFLLFSIDRN